MRLRLTSLALCCAGAVAAQPPAARYDPMTYQQSSADIPMRDGITLHVEVFSPPDARAKLPFLFERTP